MDNTVGEAIFIIKINSSEAESALNSFQDRLSDTASKGQQETASLADGFSELTSSIAGIATAGLALGGLASTIGDLTSAYNDYQAAINGVKAVASATGNSVSESLSSIKEITASGLVSQEDAAAAMKNLQLYGYSVKEATEMIKIMTDAAVYNRQANYSVSESVRVTTEGIRMENSALSDASGITTNIAKMHENYAAQLGKTTANLTNAEKAQAVYNGYLQEGGIFAGNAESYTSTLAGSQQRLETALTQVKQIMGAVFDQFAPIINGIAEWVSNNEELIASIGVFVGLLVGGGGLITAVKLAAGGIGTLNAALTSLVGTSLLAKLSVLGVVGGILALGAGTLVAAGQSVIEDTTTSVEDLGEKSGQASESIDVLGTSSDSATKKIASLQKQLNNLDRDYQRSLKQIANRHEENLATLTQQIEEANIDYRRAIDERMADFNVTLAKQERSHQETVDELMTQLSFLQRYNNDYNKQKLVQVQFALNKEQELYKRETAAQQAELELQNAADKAKLDQRLASLQAELDEELAFMNKHRDALNSVRDVILLDEIESLQERYNEQKASYQQQIDEARISGGKIGNGLSSGIEEAMQGFDLSGVGKNWGDQIVGGIANSLSIGFKKVDKIVRDNLDGIVVDKGVKTGNFWEDTRKAIFGFSSGGYTGRGAPNEVAGVVHRGEYVVPADQVDQNTGLPMATGNQTITINLAGVLATSQQAKRELGQELVRALQQTQQARLTR